MNTTPAPCSCAIDCFPPTTSMVDCAEHGMPQNLEDTAFPGSVPKFGLPISGFGENALVAPLYDQDGIDKAKSIAESLGYKTSGPVTICSLDDLVRIAASTGPKKAPSLRVHKPGCVFWLIPHPGECYIENATPGPGNGGPEL